MDLSPIRHMLHGGAAQWSPVRIAVAITEPSGSADAASSLILIVIGGPSPARGATGANQGSQRVQTPSDPPRPSQGVIAGEGAGAENCVRAPQWRGGAFGGALGCCHKGRVVRPGGDLLAGTRLAGRAAEIVLPGRIERVHHGEAATGQAWYRCARRRTGVKSWGVGRRCPPRGGWACGTLRPPAVARPAGCLVCPANVLFSGQPQIPLARRRTGVKIAGGTARDVVFPWSRLRPRVSLTPGAGHPRGRSMSLRARGLVSSARPRLPGRYHLAR